MLGPKELEKINEVIARPSTIQVAAKKAGK
jgi:hypothetical protein